MEALLILAVMAGALKGLNSIKTNSREREKEQLREKMRRWQERQKK